MKTNHIISEELKILVFCSDIDTPESIVATRQKLLSLNDIYNVDIDRDDPDNVLRVECDPELPPELIVGLVAKLGFKCTDLP